MSFLDLAPWALLVVGAFILTCGVAGMVLAAVRRVRAALADDPYDDSDRPGPCDCLACVEVGADEELGIQPIDFDLWESEWTP